MHADLSIWVLTTDAALHMTTSRYLGAQIKVKGCSFILDFVSTLASWYLPKPYRIWFHTLFVFACLIFNVGNYIISFQFLHMIRID